MAIKSLDVYVSLLLFFARIANDFCILAFASSFLGSERNHFSYYARTETLSFYSSCDTAEVEGVVDSACLIAFLGWRDD